MPIGPPSQESMFDVPALERHFAGRAVWRGRWFAIQAVHADAMSDREHLNQNPPQWNRDEGRLGRIGLGPDGIRAAGRAIWRGVLLGITLYLALTEDRDMNLRLNLIFYIIAFVWSYYDGIVSKRRWHFAWAEAIFVYLVAVQTGRILGFTFGSPVLT